MASQHPEACLPDEQPLLVAALGLSLDPWRGAINDKDGIIYRLNDNLI
jgi:hypothetical protein